MAALFRPEGITVTDYPTSLGTADLEHIRLLGHDLADDMLGKVGFGELAFWMVALRRPTASEVRVFESVLVALADHGLTPTVIAARMTYLGAPDSVQGAIAAGILGGGSRFLGATEDTGKFLADALARREGALPSSDAEWDAFAIEVVTDARARRVIIPGVGHHMHKNGDPRTPRLIAIAEEEGLKGPHTSLFEAIGRVIPEVYGKYLPLNGAGTCGAVLADLGLPIDLLRGFALLARTAGILGQLAEEDRMPIARAMLDAIEHDVVYVDPRD